MELSWVDKKGKVFLSHSAKFQDPEVKDNKLVYPSFFPGIKNEFEIGFDHIKNKVILDKKPINKGAYLILKEQLSLPKGWKVQVNNQILKGKNTLKGGFELVDHEGFVQLYIPAPEVFDQNENSHFQRNEAAKWILEQRGLQLDLKMQVEQSWLQDTDRKYPVILDPTVELTANKAGKLEKGEDDNSLRNNLNSIEVGEDRFADLAGWVQFNTESIPNTADIISLSTKLGFTQAPNTNFIFQINDVTGAYGNYTLSQFDAVWNDLRNGRYTSISIKEDPNTFWDLGDQAKQHLKDRLPENKFQYGVFNRNDDPERVSRGLTCISVEYCLSPTVSAHPTMQSTTHRGTATFSAGFTDAASVNWVYTTDGGSIWNTLNDGGSSPAISGATTNTLILSNVPASWNGREFALSGLNASCPPVYTNRALLEVTNTAPIAECKNIQVGVGNSCTKIIQPSQIDNGSFDPDGDPISLSLDIDEFSLGTHTVVLTVSDGHLADQCTAQVIVEDNRPARALCKDVTLQLDENGKASLTADDINNGSFDNCGITQMEVAPKEFDCSDLGSNAALLWVNDPSNILNICSATVTVEDNMAPVARCKNLTVPVGANGKATITAQDLDDGSTDNCGSVQFEFSDGSAEIDISCREALTKTLVVKDGNGNQSTCESLIGTEDNILPVPDASTLPTVRGECTARVTKVPSATDNCAGTIIGTTSDPLSYSTQGTHIITWTFDDGNGNVETQTQTVIIKDVTAPVPDIATLPTITASCEAGIEPPFATDNCAGQIIGTTSDPLYFDKEGAYTVTWVYDDGNGNTSSQDQTIVIMSDAAPVPDRETLPTLRAQCGLTVTQTPTAADGCGGTILATTSDPLTYNTQGTHIITWTFDDGKGNTSTQTQRVVIRDRQTPVPDRANLPALGGSCSLLITNFPTATDNCAGTVTATTEQPLEYDQEGTFAIIWNYDDGNGNTSSQTQWVIISSDAKPTAECKNISVALGNNNQVNIKAEDIDKGSYDECGSVTLLISSAGSSVFGNALPPASSMDLYCKDGKVHNLMLSVTNEKGNTAYCQATVFLEGTDSDNDGILDQCDNCPDTYNPDQKDSNNNGTGDACEESTDPGTDPGGWGGWGLKKQGQEDNNIITELRAYPNPFQEEVNLSFSLNQEEKTTMEIFNIQGQRVHTLLSEIAPKGEHRVLWDGKDQNGQPMPDGIYLVRLRAGKALINQKVILQR